MTRPARSAPPRRALPPAVVQRRWDLVVPHREALFTIARRRVNTRQDAEDAVATALLRAVEHPGLDEARVGAFLTSTVVRLTADAHRGRVRQAALRLRLAGRDVPAVPFEETVCDRDEARWLARRLRDAPERELQILRARASGLSAREAQETLGLTPKAAENAYTRVRHRAAALLSSTLAGAAATLGLTRPGPRPALVGVPVAAVSVMAAALMVVPHQKTPVPPQQAPPVQQTTQAAAETAPPPPPPAPLPRAGEAQALPRGDAPAPRPARVRPPAPERTEIRPPVIIDPRVVSVGGAYVEKHHEEESFAESVQRCINGIDTTDPTHDPCR